DVELRRLLGDKNGLTLRKNKDACRQLEMRGDCCKETEQHHGFVEWMFMRVRTGELPLTVRVCPKHVIVGDQVVVAETFGGLRVILDCVGIVADFGLGKDNSVLHSKVENRTLNSE